MARAHARAPRGDPSSTDSPRTMKVSLPRLMIPAGLFSGLLARPAAAATAPWTLTPAANTFRAERKTYGYTVNPGGEVKNGVLISNPGVTPVRLRLRATGKLGAWVKLEQREVTVGGG